MAQVSLKSIIRRLSKAGQILKAAQSGDVTVDNAVNLTRDILSKIQDETSDPKTIISTEE